MAIFVLALAILVVGAAVYGQRRFKPSSRSAARRLLQLHLLGAVDRALAPREWTEADRQRLARVRAPDATVAEHKAAVRLHVMAGRTDEGISLYRGLLARRPRDPGLLFGLGSLLLADGGVAEARAVLQKALSFEPGLWPASLRLAACLAAEGNAAEALRLSVLQARSTPGLDLERLAAAYGGAAQYALSLNRYGEALDYANRTIGLRRRTPAVAGSEVDLAQDLLVRATVYLALKSPAEAASDLDDAQQLAEAEMDRALQIHVLYARASAHRLLGQEAAAEELERQVGERLLAYADEERLRRLLALPDPVSPSGPS